MDRLPIDCITSILSHLGAEDLARSFRVCKAFYEAGTTSSIWRRLSVGRWLFCNVSGIPEAKVGETSRWHCYYVGRRRRDARMERGRPKRDYTTKTLRGHEDSITDIACVTSIGENDQETTLLISSSQDGRVKAWNVPEGTVSWDAQLGSPIRCLAVSKPMGNLLAGDEKGCVHVWLLAGGGRCITQLQAAQSPISTIILKDCGSVALVAAMEGTVQFLSLHTLQLIYSLPVQPSTNHLSFAPASAHVLISASLQKSPLIQVLCALLGVGNLF
eukprot:m.78921 g.78921  ORF g.78921 m.78921 type:complete len:273 (+) comp36118_c0_seq4:22-840(+)